jgi:hypothetical protein
VTFSLFGFILGLWAKGWEQMQFIPMLVVTPLTFLGGAFYSISMLPPAWRAFSLFKPHRVSHQRISLVLLRRGRRQHRDQRMHDPGVPGAMPRDRRLDIQDRVSIEELNHLLRVPLTVRRSP